MESWWRSSLKKASPISIENRKWKAQMRLMTAEIVCSIFSGETSVPEGSRTILALVLVQEYGSFNTKLAGTKQPGLSDPLSFSTFSGDVISQYLFPRP